MTSQNFNRNGWKLVDTEKRNESGACSLCGHFGCANDCAKCGMCDIGDTVDGYEGGTR